MVLVPEPLGGGQKLETFPKVMVRSNDALERWLNEKEVKTAGWGKLDGTKPVEYLYNEIKGDEAELELWRTSDGTVKPVRVTHVLRAKVTSPEAYRRNLFLFNTWQQFGKDAKVRVRNGLLSEKLTIAEMPFESHMLDICQRAVTEEEMQRVVDAAFRLDKHGPTVEFDESYECPIKVVEAHLVDHTIEVEESKSYTGLLTLYHLYTVDIVCTNLPVVDFNTLEFTHRDLTDDTGGERKLKYVHAWVWLEWSQIKRYLFEGSVLKERKTKGSFQDSATLRVWLSQFNLDLDAWGKGKHRDVNSLFAELENESAHLELWGRQDGVPLVMRVVHVLQVRLQSSDKRLAGQFLVQQWEQNEKLELTYVDRPLSRKLNVRKRDEATLSELAVTAVKEELNYIADSFFEFEEDFKLEELEQSGVEPLRVEYLRNWYDLEESRSFKGMFTMYHMYAFSMQCDHLPKSSFTSVHRSSDGSLTRTAWQWSTWEETASVVNARQAKMERADAQRAQDLDNSATTLSSLASAINVVVEKAPGEPYMNALLENIALLEQEMAKMRAAADSGGDNLARMFPPSMISKLAGQAIAPTSMLQQTSSWGAEQQFND